MWGLPFLLLPALLVAMDISVLFVASPAMTAALAPSATEWLWMMDVYGFVMAGLLVTMGSLGDRIGRKRLLLAGAALFGVASVGVAYASSPAAVIASRAVLGVAAATLAPSTLSLIRGMVPDETRRRRAVGAWTVAFTGGAVAGPIVGGLLLEHFWWGSVFLVNVPVMAVLLIGVPFLVPESCDPRPAPFDLPGAALSLVAVLALVFAVKHTVEGGWDAASTVAAATAVAAGALFLRGQTLVDIGLFRRPAFAAAVGANTVVAFATAGLGLLAFTYLQAVRGLGPLEAALWAAPTFAGTLAGATAGATLKLRPGILVPTGLVVGAAGFAVVGLAGPESSLVVFVGGYTVLTLGVGVVGTVANALVLTTAPADRAGAAAGVSETSMELGAALGIATLGTVASAVYRSAMRRAGARGPAAETVTAAGGDVAASAAYTTGLGVAALTGAAVLLAVAVAAATALRRTPA